MQNNTFSTLFVGQNFIKLKEVDSTNNFLKDLLSKSEPLADGTVIMADNQFAGRGQQAQVWLSEAGQNISLSLYLNTSFLPLNKQFYLNIAVSLAVGEAVSSFLTTNIKVKWPNDIYFGSKKLGGILIENTLKGAHLKSSVIGVGLNINQQRFTDNIADRAISLFNILGKETDLMLISNQFLIFMEKYYFMLKAGEYQLLQNNYLKQLYNFDISASYSFNGGVFEGVIKGVTDTGQLILETSNELKSFNFKEIELIHTK
ncbi:biotin--[acetyl-CoA-carboxylase] ligase [Pedobacter sandarakinus]|uniref:biotin--[acetyl-CoA-carboxylase] ligase n=1 Tax=Pedobacter sandarakinus TaxID=353156 RepID=UPI002247099D|nr:biotin--[acetyl-CoA-carboxylase] ligase [Pedobacter sandarakinus]MCX2573725.1 biotin--[acetyl-CoA-carboxylase] ligase [Pedobacter sandarakinus]